MCCEISKFNNTMNTNTQHVKTFMKIGKVPNYMAKESVILCIQFFFVLLQSCHCEELKTKLKSIENQIFGVKLIYILYIQGNSLSFKFNNILPTLGHVHGLDTTFPVNTNWASTNISSNCCFWDMPTYGGWEQILG